jgi:phosphoenolpyruvate carboxykinase (ATP)
LGLYVADACYNATETPLLEKAVIRGEGKLSRHGALVVRTGKFTGRSPKDKHIAREASSEDLIWWEGNNALSPDHFETLKSDIFAYLAHKSVDVQDLICGADPALKRRSTSIRALPGWTKQHLKQPPTHCGPRS